MIFHENRLPTDDSHEISCLICYFWKSHKILNCSLLQNIGGALQVKYRSKQCGPRTDCSSRSSLFWVHTVCHRGFLNISADEKSRRLLLRLAHLGLTLSSFCSQIRYYTRCQKLSTTYIFAQIIFKLALRNFLDTEDLYLL